MNLPENIFTRAAEQKRDAEHVLAIHALLMKLMHHHNSQSKPDTPPCSREYHKQLSTEIHNVLSPLFVKPVHL